MANPTFVQLVAPPYYSDTSVMALAWSTQNLTVNSLLIASIGIWNLSRSVSTVTDTAGNTWYPLSSHTDTQKVEIWYAINTLGGGTKPTVTVNLDGVSVFEALLLAEYFPCNTANPIDVHAVGTMTLGSPWTGPPVTTNNSDELIVCLGIDFSSSGGAKYYVFSPWTSHTQDVIIQGRSFLLDGPASTPGTYTPTGTQDTNHQFFSVATLAIRPPVVPSTGVPNSLMLMGCGT